MFVDIHSHRYNSLPNVIRVSHCDPDRMIDPTSFFSIGIHPWNVHQNSLDVEMDVLKSRLNDNHLLMIGECGLDKIKGGDWALQKDVFLRQVAIAESIGLPLIIHCVKSYNEMIDIHRDHHSVPWIFHAFNGSPQLAVQLCKLGFYLSMGQRQLVSSKGQEALQSIALDRLFFETDDTDDDIIATYALAASILSMPLLELIAKLECNFKSVVKADFLFI